MLDLPQLREGQIVRVFQKIKEGKRERNVPFMGKLLKVRGSGINQTITVKQHLEGIEVEKIFPVMLPTLTKIEVVEQTRTLVKGQPVAKRKSKSKKSSASTKSRSKSKSKGK